MKKNKILLLLLMAGYCGLKAQQLPIYSQYMLNNFTLNPAIAGTDGYFNVKSDDRFQWIGITDPPQTYILSMDGPITIQHIGIGGYIYTDITGPTRQTGITSSYSYHMQLTKDLNLSLGISAGILQYSIDGQAITLVQQNDQALANQFVSAIVPSFAAGAYLYSSKFYFGISAPQVVPITAKLNSFAGAEDQLVTHFYAIGGYNFDLGNNFGLDPSVELNYVNPVPPQVDMGARILYQQKYWIGGGFRTGDAAYALVGYTYLDNLTFGFSYDYPVTAINEYSIGTFELFIGLKFNKHKSSDHPLM
jgi:type IX secretion system PorP/SprF family membrane protein